MEHFKPFQERDVLRLKRVEEQGWQLKRYAILAAERTLDDLVADAATMEALSRLPKAGTLQSETGNHGIGFQIVHFAETAVVSPVFYWQWGSVLAQPFQVKADWKTPTEFRTGPDEIVGCIWEMNIVRHEVEAWTLAMLGQARASDERLSVYMDSYAQTT